MAVKEKRQLNYELLRIIAMMMIVCLHCLSKGGLLGDSARPDMNATGYVAWLIEAFCLVAVNCYVLISGYFGASEVKKEISIKRPFRIWKQVLFYSLAIGILAMAAGLQEFDIYQIFQYVFPLVTEHYWFATSYVVLCLFMPFLNAGIEMLEKKVFQGLLGGMLLIFCIAKTVIPMQLPWDKYGYDAYWFVVLYLTGAYIKRYGIKVINSRVKALCIYFVGEAAIFVSFVVLRFLFFGTGSLGEFLQYAYTYNHLFCYIGAIGLFMAFGSYASSNDVASSDAGKIERFRKPIGLMASATFGVYLIHEHVNIRDKWGLLVDAETILDWSVPMFVLWLVTTVLIIYAVCTLIELFRQWVASGIRKFLSENKV